MSKFIYLFIYNVMFIGQCRPLLCTFKGENKIKKTNIGINKIQKYKIYTKFQDIILLT